MSIVNDSLFEEKVKELQEIEKQLEQEKNNVYNVLGQWLANALDDKNNKQLIDLFVNKHDDKKYLSLKRQRAVSKKIADNLKSLSKTADSNHADNVVNPAKKAEKIDDNKSDDETPKQGGLLNNINR